MRQTRGRRCCGYGVILLLLSFVPPLEAAETTLSPITPLIREQSLSPEMVALGEALFHDPRLSGDDSISCASCHSLALSGVDQRVSSIGIQGQVGTINAPTVFNSGYNFVQFWDGRAATLEEQAAGPVANPIEMGAQWSEVVERLSSDQPLVAQFRRLFAEGLTAETIRQALATFERSLVTMDAPFDRWLRGERDALSPAKLRGYRLFTQYGCISCHQGRLVGGNMYAKMGTMRNYFLDRGGEITPSDLGRFNVTGDEGDRHSFKVPSLRLAVKTMPYFHDGSVRSLAEAVDIMAKYQLGRTLSPRNNSDIVDFISALHGQHPLLE
ncbi:MAG: cytochrome-c peroxidase [Gammaproteobacteria bacterium]|nr:cytochrome-c peroxidase [Gammaproteobacteria bacterium]